MNLSLFAKRAFRYTRRRLVNCGGPRLTSVQSISDAAFVALFDAQKVPDFNTKPTSELTTALLGHFGDRFCERRPLSSPQLTDLRIDLSGMTDRQIIERADDALQGNIHPSGLKPIFDSAGLIEWGVNPSGSREWLLMIHRHAWWVLWGVAYQKTHDEKYAAAFVRQLVDWIDKNPMPDRKSENLESWRLMEVGLRGRISWIPSFILFYDSPMFVDAAKLKMLRAFYDHGQMLNSFFTNRNHLVRESNGLLSLGLFFPEFNDAEKWIAAASGRIDNELASQINDDGSQIEMSVGYQWLSVDEFNATYKMLREHNRQLPNENIEATLGKMVEYLGVVSRPDGSFPQLNDGFILWDSNDLATLGHDLGNNAIEYIGSGGHSGSIPDYCSRSLPNAGLHVMRSDWSKTARWSIFDTGPYGGPHGHEDKLSFELFALAAPFIVDPGSYTYSNADLYREYFVSSRGHNTVLVDGCSQVRRWDAGHILPVVDSSNHGRWQSDESVDFASGKYTEGYAPFSMRKPEGMRLISDVVHQRDMMYAKPEYWVIVDYLDSQAIHEYDFLFHLGPDISASIRLDSSILLRSNLNGAQLLLFPVAHCSLQLEIVTGTEAPIQGWYSPDHHKKQPSPTLVVRAKEKGGLVAAWVFYPLASDLDADCVDVALVNSERASDLKFTVTVAEQISTVVVREKFKSGENGESERTSDISITNSAREKGWSVHRSA